MCITRPFLKTEAGAGGILVSNLCGGPIRDQPGDAKSQSGREFLILCCWTVSRRLVDSVLRWRFNLKFLHVDFLAWSVFWQHKWIISTAVFTNQDVSDFLTFKLDVPKKLLKAQNSFRKVRNVEVFFFFCSQLKVMKNNLALLLSGVLPGQEWHG